MKTVQNILGLIALSISLSAHAESSVVCDHSLKATSSLFQNALTNIYSFEYVHHALEQVMRNAGPQEVTFCTSSVAVDKNIYQYLEHIVAIDAYVGNNKEPQYTFRLRFQNASVQAFHNVGGQPWIGLDAKQTQGSFDSFVAAQKFTTLLTAQGMTQSADIAKLSRTYNQDSTIINANTFSTMPLVSDQKSTTYLASWLTSNSANPFATPSLTKGVLVRIFNDGHVDIAENIYVKSDLLFALEDQLEKQTDNLPAKEDWIDVLIKLSLPATAK